MCSSDLSVPVTATEGTPVTYGLALRNGTSGGAATLATGIVLRASFDEAGLTFPAATGCAQDVTPPVGYGTSITCSLADLAADTVRTLVFTVYAPATASGLDLEATFAVTYAESAGTITANDADGPTIASITPLPTAGAVTVEQSFDVPTTTTTDVTTVPVTGLSADDQTGSVVSLPGGFLGSLDSSEVLEPRTADRKSTRLNSSH